MSVRGQPIYDKKYWKKIEQKFNTAEYQEQSHLSILKIFLFSNTSPKFDPIQQNFS